MAKQFLFGADGRRELEDGVRKLAKAVRVTLGPTGRSVLQCARFRCQTALPRSRTTARFIGC